MKKKPWYKQPDKIFFSLRYADILSVLKRINIAPETFANKEINELSEDYRQNSDYDTVIEMCIDSIIEN